MLAEGLGIYKDTRLLCKLLLEYGRNVSKVVRFGIYERMTEKSARALDLVYLANGSMADMWTTSSSSAGIEDCFIASCKRAEYI